MLEDERRVLNVEAAWSELTDFTPLCVCVFAAFETRDV